MAITGDIIATHDDEKPLKVVFRRGDEIIAEEAVETASKGESVLRVGLSRLQEEERRKAEHANRG
jgi:hypothetical protein